MKFKWIISVLTCIFILSAVTACKPGRNKIYTIGDSIEAYDASGAAKYKITLASAQYSQYQLSENCLLELTYKIKPYSALTVCNDNVYILGGTTKYHSVSELNIAKNGYDLFETSLTVETIYTFAFLIPQSPYFLNLQNREEGCEGWALNCNFIEAKFNISTGILFDNQN